MIYFVKLADKVKIGFSKNVERRMSELRTLSPFDLEVSLVISGSIVTERERHRVFRASRLSRELFRYEGAVADFIERERNVAERQNQVSESQSELFLKKVGDSI